MVYRKSDSVLSDEWHFHPDCLLWPQADYAELDIPPVEKNDRLCLQCIALESADRRNK
jgi:hypothetical protein